MIEQLAKLAYIIPPAIIAGFIIYYIRILGRIIYHYQPYADNRKHSEDYGGFVFFVVHILFPLILAFLTYFFIPKFTNIIIFTYLPMFVTVIVWVYYHRKFKVLEHKLLNKSEKIERIAWIGKPYRYFTPFYVLFTLAIFNYFSENYLVITLNYLAVFIVTFVITRVYAISTKKPRKANIYFKNKSDDIKDCKIFKITEEIVRIQKDKNTILLNKSDIKYIEFLEYEEKKNPQQKSKTSTGKLIPTPGLEPGTFR